MSAKLKKLIDSDGFVLKTTSLDEQFRNDVLNSKSPSDFARRTIKKILNENGFEDSPLQIVYESFILGDSNALHTHLVPADFQLLVWVPKDDNFVGRSFLYGKKDGPIKQFKPRLGDICFMKTNDLEFVHGVTELTSDTLVKTVIVSVNCLADHGEHLTVTSDLKPV